MITPVSSTLPEPDAVAGRLLEWALAGNLRALPWRTEPRDPYVVWVSEVMLQQTQVVTATPYFLRWMARFPTVADLAGATQEEVLKAWEGLGYYSRARNLHAAAGIVVQQHGGRLPADPKALLALPGIGRYTAGALLSIAFGQRAALLDGNVKRVLARAFDVDTPAGASSTESALWRLAGQLVDAVTPGQAGALNEGLMELGATVCTPRGPRCVACPLVDLCLARQRGTQEERPVRVARRPLPHFDVAAAVLARPDHPGQFLIAQRPPEGMLGGLWEFPGGKRHAGESLEECLRREMQEELAVQVAVGAPVTTIVHAYTHFRITLHAFACRLLAGEPQVVGVADWRWVSLNDLDAYPFAVTDQKIIAALRAGGSAP